MGGLKIFLNKKYFGVALPFIINSLMMSTWLLYTPYTLGKLGITESQLGYAFFSMALGAVTSLSFSTKLIHDYGEGRYTFISTLGYILVIIFAVLMTSLSQLCILLFFAGAFAGSMDVGMNALVAHIEKVEDKRLLSACHGFWSIGFFIGASLGSVLLFYLDSPFVHMFLMATIAIVLHLAFFTPLRQERTNDKIVEAPGKKRFQNKTLLGFAVIGLMVMMSEGVVMDWSTLYMSQEIKVPELFIGYGLGMFSLFMAVGRFMMDPISDTYGSKFIVQGGLVVMVLGVVLVLAGTLFSALFGFAMIGFGVSGILPEIYRLSSKVEGVNACDGVATVAGTGYIGFLIGPIFIGYIVDGYGYPVIFMLVALLTILALFMTKVAFQKKIPRKLLD